MSPGASEATPLATPAPAGVKPLHMEQGAGTPLVQVCALFLVIAREFVAGGFEKGASILKKYRDAKTYVNLFSEHPTSQHPAPSS